MPDMSAEKFAQRAFDFGLMDAQQLELVWSDFGSREVPLHDFTTSLVRKELLTNFQVTRLLEGKREGYFYGDYKVLYLVGAGTFARVYRAVHKETGRQVAVKVLRQRYADDMITTDQFLREAKMVMKLRHPNIVPIHQVEEERGRPFMVMEFIEGQNLRDFVKVRKMGVDESLRLMVDIMAGLDYAFQKGVTHRDLKLSNVLVSSMGVAKLVDFGLAAISAEMSDEAIASASNPRSIDYVGLERTTGVRKNDPRSDVFFAGCMLYHMLGSRPPLYETRDRIKRLSPSRYREIRPISELVPDLPHYVIAILNKAMELRPERRFSTPGEFLAELKVGLKRVEAGDSGSPADLESDAPTAAPDAGDLEQDVTGRTVMVVESKIEIQNVLRERLKRRGYRVLVIGDPERALARFEDPKPAADCVVFCTEELGRSALEAFNRFATDEQTRHLPAVLLVDKKQKELIRQAKLAEHRVMLSMPLKVRELRQTLLRLLSQPSNP